MESYFLFSYKVLKYTHWFLFILQKDALMYHKFGYFVQKNQPLLLSLGCCIEEKIRQISGAYNKQLSGELSICFCEKF